MTPDPAARPAGVPLRPPRLGRRRDRCRRWPSWRRRSSRPTSGSRRRRSTWWPPARCSASASCLVVGGARSRPTFDRRRVALSLGGRRRRLAILLWALPLYEDLSRPAGNLHLLRRLLSALPQPTEHSWQRRHRRRVGSAGDLPAGALPRARPRVDGRRHDRAPPAGRRAGGGGGGRPGDRLAAPRPAGRAPLGDLARADRRRHLRGARDPRRDLRLPGRLDLGARDSSPGPPSRRRWSRRSGERRARARRAGRRLAAARARPARGGRQAAWSATATSPWRR